MFHPRHRYVDGKRRTSQSRHSGLTLVELLMVSTVLVLIAGALAGLATVVQIGNDHNFGQSESMQHGRVALERIQRAINESTASEKFPGALVASEVLGGWTYPDTLVVWRPAGRTAVDPDGLPRVNELVVFCPDPSAPDQLMEVTKPNDSRTMPPLSDSASWQAEIASFKSSDATRRVQLTDLLRVAAATDSDDVALSQRGVVRFDLRLRPSEVEWAEFLAGDRTWSDLSWPQGIHGSRSGLRQTWCRIELQMRPSNRDDHSSDAAIPVFGSAAIYYTLNRP